MNTEKNYEYYLTRKQEDLLKFLLKNNFEYSYFPTLDELCGSLGLKSRGSLYKHVKGLVDAGLVKPANKKQRGVRLTPKAIDNYCKQYNYQHP